MKIQTFVILVFFFCFGSSEGQTEKVSSINGENYYNYILPDNKILFLTEGEIKIILTGELQRLGYTAHDNSWYQVNDENKLKGKLVLTIQDKQTKLPTGFFLYSSAVPISKSDSADFICKKVTLRRTEHTDPIESNGVELNESCYWYQRNNNALKQEFVSRTIIVKILQADIKKIVDAINKQ